MREKPLLIILTLASTLFATAAQAYDNCDSLRYNDRAYQACVNNAYGGNSKTSPSMVPIYGPSEEEQETERKRLAREAAERERRNADPFEEMRKATQRERAIEQANKAAEYAREVAARQDPYLQANKYFNAARDSEKSGNDKLAEIYFREAERQMAMAEYDHPHDYALMLESLGESLRRQGRYDDALPLLTKALSKRERLQGENHPDLGDVLISLGRTYIALGRYDVAEPVLLKALSTREMQYGKTNEQAAYCHVYLGSLYAKQKRYDDAVSQYKEAVSIQTERLGEEHANTIHAMKQLATLYRYTAEHNKADKLDMKIREAAQDPHYTSTSTKPPQAAQTTPQWEMEMNALSDEAVQLSNSGKPALAIEKARKALALAEKNAVPTYNLVPSSQYLLAKIFLANDQKEEAEALMKAAIQTLEQRHGADSGTVATVLLGLAELYVSQSRYSEAEPLLLRVAATREKNFQQDPSAAINSLNALSDNYLLRGGHKKESESVLRRILEHQEKRLGPEHAEVAQACNNLAYNLYLQRDYKQAEALYKRSQAILGNDAKVNKTHLLDALTGLRKLYLVTGRKAEAAQIDKYERTLTTQN